MAQALTVKPVTSTQERPLVTIEFAPHIHPSETQYSYEHPLFVFGERVELINSFPSIGYTVCALELIESKTPSGRLLNQPRWKYKVTNGEVSFWKDESALVRWSKQSSTSTDTCVNCQYAERYPLGHFHDFHEHNRGWCNRFDHPAKTHHIKTNDCILNTDTEKVEPFPTEVIELDRDGYPIEEVSPTGYFSADFVTNSNEPF